MERNQNIGANTLWMIILVLLTFLLGRAHYMIPSQSIYNFFSFDAQFWWNYQIGIQNPQIFSDDPFFQARIQYRFASDIFLQESIVWLAKKYGVALITLNLIITTFIFSLSIVFLYLLGLSVLNNPKWSFFFALLISQCTYIQWLRYPIFTPKMIGFMLYPLVLRSLIRVSETSRGHWISICLLLSALILYPGSLLYYFPPLLVSSLLAVFLFRDKEKSCWEEATPLLIVLTSTGIAMIILKLSHSSYEPTPLFMAEYYYTHHRVEFPKTIGLYIKDYLDYLILTLGAFVYLYWSNWNIAKKKATFLFAAFMCCLFFALITHMAASHIDEIRMLWLWRSAYYSYVPGILLIVLALQELWKRRKIRIYKMKISRMAFPVLLLLLVIIRTPNTTDTLKGTIKSLQDLSNPSSLSNGYNQHLNRLTTFASTTSEKSVFLLPHRRYYDKYLRLFAANAQRRAVMDKLDIGLMNIYHKLTRPYYLWLRQYDEIENSNNLWEYQRGIVELARATGASHIIHSVNHRFQLTLPLLHTDSHWLVYKTEKPTLPRPHNPERPSPHL